MLLTLRLTVFVSSVIFCNLTAWRF